MSVKLRKRKNTDGSITLYLDIIDNGRRKYEFLKKKIPAGKAPENKREAREAMLWAEEKKVIRERELMEGAYNFDTAAKGHVIVTEWMQKFVDGYQLKDKRNMGGALNKFRDFLALEKMTGLKFSQLTEDIVIDFMAYLKRNQSGEGVSSYFYRFKKMVKIATRKKFLKTNPAAEITIGKTGAKVKDILTMQEIKILAETDISNQQVKRAFLFCCMTGLRWADVKTLLWKHIRLSSKELKKEQTKVEGEGKTLRLNLNSTALKILEEQGQGKPDEPVFTLPSANGANKTLRAWVKRAKIQKDITWHCARHSAGTNLIFNGADVTTVSSILGHTSLKHTQRYVREAKALKERATDSLSID